MLVKDIANVFEQFAPLTLQENYDNSGLCIGNKNNIVIGILLAIDITEEVIDEAIKRNCNLIISHHPLIFAGIKNINGNNLVERCIIKAIQNNINIYSAHTNFDSVSDGVSHKMCEKLELKKCKILEPSKGILKKLVTFVPVNEAEKVRSAIFAAGAGHIGNYDCCSYNIQGSGSFRGNECTSPYVGAKNVLHFEDELRIETIFPNYLQKTILSALLAAHPYEEVAYDIYPLENDFSKVGMGMIGELDEAIPETEMLKRLKSLFDVPVIKHTPLLGKSVQRIAVCGGSGAFMLKSAIRADADMFVSADFKYHQYFDADRTIVITDIGHYESEQFTKEIFYNLLMKNFPNFAVHFSRINTNPINYY